MADRVLILGAGPTGIGAALRLLEKGHSNFVVLEAEDHPGGLASSITDDKGFTWDVGGHVQFSHYKHFDDAMDLALGKDGWIYHERRSHIWIRDRFVPYPFQNNIHHLDAPERDSCLAGLEIAALESKENRKPKNFKEWILASFGIGIANVFMLPYNFKVWAYKPETLDYQWIGDRVSVVNVDRVKENIRLRRDDVNWGPNNQFRFPLFGGTGAVWRALAKKIPKANLRFKEAVTGIDLEKRTLQTSKNKTEKYDYLISAIPVDAFATLSGDTILISIGKKMVYSGTNIVGVGLKGDCPTHLKDKCWMYFPESDSPFYRVTVFSNYSPNNVPDITKYWSLMAETSESPVKPLNSDSLLEETIQGFIRTKLLADRNSIVSTWQRHVSHGYPTPFLGRDSLLDAYQKKLQSLGVYSRGRFGGWKYEVSNQDHSFMQGVEAVDHMLEGKEELTYWQPNVVNSGSKK